MDLQGLLTSLTLQRAAQPGYSLRRKRHEGDKGGVDGSYWAFDYTCLSEILLICTHCDTARHTHPPLFPVKQPRVAGQLTI
jgi:hypothetical protein